MQQATIKTVLAIVGLSIALLGLSAPNIQAEMYKVATNDIIPNYTYVGISKVLDSSKSFEDIDHVYMLIENSDMVATYLNQGSNGNFVLSSIELVSDE